MKMYFVLAAVVLLGTGSAWAGTRVVVLPVGGTSADMKRDAWIGPAVAQNMILALGRAPDVTAVAYDGKIGGALDAEKATHAARASRADLAVIGAFEVVGGQVRLTAQVVDATSGQVVGTAQVTGEAAGLLALEDQLAEDTRGALALPLAAEAPQVAAVPAVMETYAAGAYDAGYGSYPLHYSYLYGGYFGGWYAPMLWAGSGRPCYYGGGLRWRVQGDNWWISFGGGNGGHHGSAGPVPTVAVTPRPVTTGVARGGPAIGVRTTRGMGR